MTSRSRSWRVRDHRRLTRTIFIALSECPTIKGMLIIPPPPLLCHVCLATAAVRVVRDGGRADRMTREEVCEREQVPKRSSIATGDSTSGPITSWYSRIKSHIVILYSFVYHNTIHRRWILADVSHYSGGIIIPLCESARDRDPTSTYAFFLPALLFIPSSYLPRFSLSNKWKHLDLRYPCPRGTGTTTRGDNWRGAARGKDTQARACFREGFDMKASVIAIPLGAGALDYPPLLSQKLRNRIPIL